jgi:hypothetical protein
MFVAPAHLLEHRLCMRQIDPFRQHFRGARQKMLAPLILDI